MGVNTYHWLHEEVAQLQTYFESAAYCSAGRGHSYIAKMNKDMVTSQHGGTETLTTLASPAIWGHQQLHEAMSVRNPQTPGGLCTVALN